MDDFDKGRMQHEKNQIAKRAEDQRKGEFNDKMYAIEKTRREKKQQHLQNLNQQDKKMLFDAKHKAGMERMKAEFKAETALKVEENKSHNALHRQKNKQRFSETQLSVQLEKELYQTNVNNLNDKELRDIDFDHSVQTKYLDTKLHIEEKNQEFVQTKELEGSKQGQDRSLKVLDIENQQQLQVNQFKQEQYTKQLEQKQEQFLQQQTQKQEQYLQRENHSQEQFLQKEGHNQEIRLKEEERQTIRVKSEEDIRNYGEKAKIDVQAYIYKSEEDERSYLVKSDEDLRTKERGVLAETEAHKKKLIAETQQHLEKELIDTQEIGRRTRLEMEKKTSEIMGKTFNDIVNGEIQKEVLWVEAEVKVWLAEKLGKIMTDEELGEYIKENKDTWNKEV